MDDPEFVVPNPSDELITVATYDDDVAARLALNHLREAGLPAVLSDENTIAMDWLLSNAIGGIKVQVNPKDALVARQLIDEHEQQHAEMDGAPSGDSGASAQWRVESQEEDSNDDNESDEDLEEDLPLTTRERDSVRALRGAVFGILFPPIELYVAYLVYRVFVSRESLGARYRNMTIAAAFIMLLVLGGVYAFIRPR
jgi:hypothetical protein